MRRTVTAELPGWVGNISIASGGEGWWMDVHTLTGVIKVPFTPPEGTKGFVLGGDPPDVVVSVSLTLDFVEDS